jgi:hypothetical protein
MSIWTKPSFYSLAITGILILLVFIKIIFNWNEFEQLALTDYLIILLLLTIGLGIHGLLHLGLEVHYNYNPLE